MLETLKHLFDAMTPAAASDTREEQERALQLAAAVLLVEVMRADAVLDAAQRRAIIDALRDEFGLADDAIERLVELAEQTAPNAPDYFSFTSRINENFSMEQKIQMIEHMWRVAYANGRLDAAENHLLHKVGELLYVPHGAYINAKMRAHAASGAD